MIGTAYKNCSSTVPCTNSTLTISGEHREFVFTLESTVGDAHVCETGDSRARRQAKIPESDPHVLEQMKTMQNEAQNGN